MEKKKTSRGASQDRKKVAGAQEYEVKYESEKTGSSRDEVKKAIKTAGNSRKKVESKLGNGKSRK